MKINSSEFIRDAQQWDDRELGASEEHVEVVSKAEMEAFNDALSLQAISIRLQKSLIEDLKAIAHSYGIGYQPMVRDLLQRFVLAEKRQELNKQLAKLTEYEERHQKEDTVPVNEFIESIRKQA